jgi:cytochrome c oxidase subunit 2
VNRPFSVKAVRILLPFGIAALVVAMLPIPTFSAPATHTIALDARQFEFAPARIEVNQGDTVIIEVHADDVVHGFYLDGYGIDTRIEPGISKRIEFVAERTGKFRYRCSVTCGTMHPFMIGELVVGPNTLLWRAVALAFIVAIGVLMALRYSSQAAAERIRI